jgi:hypothetical protein
MKWVKFDEDFSEYGKLSRLGEKSKLDLYKSWERTEIKDACFKIYKDLATFEENHLFKDYHVWHRQKCLPKAYFQTKYGRGHDTEAHPYEIYIGAWLNFYDSVVQNGNSDHAVYFEWDDKEYYVTVHILQLMPSDKILNINVNVKIANPPASQDPPPPKNPPPYC